MIPESEWLEQAKRLSVGMRIRVRHGRESRANMTIANERDRWWCYCQRCKDGAVLPKDHVLLTGDPVVEEIDFTIPSDLRPVLGSEYEETVGRFLASKNMMFPYLPKLWYSLQARRVCLQDDAGHWHGRDLTGRSNAKWLHYNKDHLVGVPGRVTVITEDLFSMYKVRFAIHRDYTLQDVHVGTTLGAGCSTTAALALKNCKTLVWAYDGDHAGDEGYKSASKRMRVLVPRQFRARPPEGLDPKDMDCASIRELLKGVLHAS